MASGLGLARFYPQMAPIAQMNGRIPAFPLWSNVKQVFTTEMTELFYNHDSNESDARNSLPFALVAIVVVRTRLFAPLFSLCSRW
jgi:hypothetical protein